MEGIPNEILIIIFNLLSTAEKIILSCVSRRLRDMFLFTPLIHRNASFKHCWHVPGRGIYKYINSSSKSIHHLDLQGCYWLKNSDLMKSLCKCSNLISLDLRGCKMPIIHIIVLMEKLPHLKHLGLDVLANNTNIVKRYLYIEPCFKRLSSLSFRVQGIRASFENLFRKLPDLKSLEVTIIEPTSLKYQALQVKPKNDSTSVFNTFVLPYHCNNIEDFNNIEHVECKILGFSNVDIGSLKKVLCSLHCPTLEHLSLSHITSCILYDEVIDALEECLLSRLSNQCLQSIDFEDFQFSNPSIFKTIVEKCEKLKHINILDFRYKNNPNKRLGCGSREQSFETVKLLSKCHFLESLALNPCWLMTGPTGTNSLTNPLLSLVQSCRYVTEFELVQHYDDVMMYLSRVSRNSNKTSAVTCIASEQLASISQWQHLQKLTLAGFEITGNGNFLPQICQSCTELMSLSLANLKGIFLNHSGNIVSFHEALSHCHNLRDFRLEQPYFNITASFLQALHHAQKLERVCWKLRNGKLAEDQLEPWMDKCGKVIYVQICCDVSKKASKMIEKLLTTKYGSRRQALMVGVYPYYSIQHDPFKELVEDPSVPLGIHFEEMMMPLASRVAKPYNFLNIHRI